MYIFLLFALIANCAYAMDLANLTLDEKIGQLFMVAAVSNPDRNDNIQAKKSYPLDPAYVEQLIKTYHVGGVIFLGTGIPEEQAAITEKFQSISETPLLIALDAEWGLSMRLTGNVVKYPRAGELGKLAPEDDELIYDLGKEIGEHCKAIGVHINLAPVADVNSNPQNPVINTRSFGATPDLVCRKATLFMRGLQAAGIMTCAKHFPGHGDTHVDSHVGLPFILHSRERLKQIELAPFKHLIDRGVDAVMPGHLVAQMLGGAKPASLSRSLITDVLKQELGFSGLVITDALDMKAVTDRYYHGDIAVRALKAGNDILLCPVDVPVAFAAIRKAIADGTITKREIDEKVTKILAAKHRAHAGEKPSHDFSILTSERAKKLAETLKVKIESATQSH